MLAPLTLFFVVAVLAATGCDATDLYKILGLQRNASTSQIKSAYRRKARDTHPDKRGDEVSAEEAAEAFRQVVHAFEVLSDDNSRRRYDRGEDVGSSTSSKPSSTSTPFQWHFQRQHWNIPLKDKPEVKQAQARVLHVVSLDQLRTIMLDDNDKLERNLLMCFFTPKLEEMVTDKLVFPYPFAGMSPERVWWEELLQTISIRFNRSNDLSRYFNVPNGDDMTEPLFIFLKRGTALGGDSFEYDDESKSSGGGKSHILSTSNRDSFESWMWSMIEVKVEFINLHSHPVELYWIHGGKATMKVTLEPNRSSTHYSKLTHEFYARDNRVDTWAGSPGRWKLSTDSGLGRWKIGVAGEDGTHIEEDGSVVVVVPHKSCVDLSAHCSFWANQNQCKNNENFMRDKCKVTCGYCSSDGAGESNDGDSRASKDEL